MPKVEFTKSAFKHGLSEKEILNALNDEETYFDEKTQMFIGQISKGDLIEIKGRIVIDRMNKPFLVYHAQKIKFKQ